VYSALNVTINQSRLKDDMFDIWNLIYIIRISLILWFKLFIYIFFKFNIIIFNPTVYETNVTRTNTFN